MTASLYRFLVSDAGRLASVLVGVALLLWGRRSVVARRSHVAMLPVAGAVVVGLLLFGGALFPAVWHWIARTTHLTRIRLLMGAVSVLVLLVACESIRHAYLRERYALLWVVTGLLILLCALVPDSLGWVSRTFGMQYVTTVVAVVFTFLILVSFHFSLALSRSEEKLGKVAQRCAQLEARLERLEAAAGLAMDGTPRDRPGPSQSGPL